MLQALREALIEPHVELPDALTCLFDIIPLAIGQFFHLIFIEVGLSEISTLNPLPIASQPFAKGPKIIGGSRSFLRFRLKLGEVRKRICPEVLIELTAFTRKVIIHAAGVSVYEMIQRLLKLSSCLKRDRIIFRCVSLIQVF